MLPFKVKLLERPLAAASGLRYKNRTMADAKRLPNKKDVARALLLKGSMFVHLDPRRDDVMVPAWLTNQAQLVLQVGLDMPVPIPDLRVDDAGVFGTLSFNRTPFTCAVPWDAVFAVVGDDGRGMVWPESMPAEIAQEVEREAKRAGVSDLDDDRSEERISGAELVLDAQRALLGEVEEVVADSDPLRDDAPRLQVISGSASGSRPPESGRATKRPPYLRVVK